MRSNPACLKVCTGFENAFQFGDMTLKSAGEFLCVLFVMATLISPTEAQDRSQTRSMVITRYGIVATEHPIASQIGATILSEGGNAVDAAVAAHAALGGFLPVGDGIGGGEVAPPV